MGKPVPADQSRQLIIEWTAQLTQQASGRCSAPRSCPHPCWTAQMPLRANQNQEQRAVGSAGETTEEPFPQTAPGILLAFPPHPHSLPLRAHPVKIKIKVKVKIHRTSDPGH